MSDFQIVQQAVGQISWRLLALYIGLVKYKNTVIPAIPAGMTANTYWSINLHTEQRIGKV